MKLSGLPYARFNKEKNIFTYNEILLCEDFCVLAPLPPCLQPVAGLVQQVVDTEDEDGHRDTVGQVQEEPQLDIGMGHL